MNLSDLYQQIHQVLTEARHRAYQAVNQAMVQAYWRVGGLIVEHEQRGAKRASYGKEVLNGLSKRLTKEFGRGFSVSNLEYMRRFYLCYKNRLPSKGQTVSGESLATRNSQTLSGNSENQQPSLSLSWSHYVFLLGIENEKERAFYEIEARQNDWSLRDY